MPELWTMLAVKAAEIMVVNHWYDREEMIRQLVPVVPPGVAIRRAERDRTAPFRQKGEEAPPRIAPRWAEVAATGARAVVRDFLKAPCFEQQRPQVPGRRRAVKTMVRMTVVPKRATQYKRLQERRETKARTEHSLGAWELRSPHQADAARVMVSALRSAMALFDAPALAARLGAHKNDIRPLVTLITGLLGDVVLDLETSVEVYVASTTQ